MIDQFDGENLYLSNMYPLDTWIKTEKGLNVPTAEHAYQAAKFEDRLTHTLISKTRSDKKDSRIIADGLAAKEKSEKLIEYGVEIRHDWEVAKNGIMLAIVAQKFLKNPELAEKLVQTGDEEIVEDTDQSDKYWVVDSTNSDNDKNHLGEILTIVRSSLQQRSEL